MKTALAILALTLVSCSTPEKNARLGALVDLAITVAQSRGAISAQDAADIRAAETIILPSTTIETTSGK